MWLGPMDASTEGSEPGSLSVVGRELGGLWA